jgi:D-mannonate dehydratase
MEKAGFFPEDWKQLGLVYWYLDNVIKVDEAYVSTAETMSSVEGQAIQDAIPENAKEANERLIEAESERLRNLAASGEWD